MMILLMAFFLHAPKAQASGFVSGYIKSNGTLVAPYIRPQLPVYR